MGFDRSVPRRESLAKSQGRFERHTNRVSQSEGQYKLRRSNASSNGLETCGENSVKICFIMIYTFSWSTQSFATCFRFLQMKHMPFEEGAEFCLKISFVCTWFSYNFPLQIFKIGTNKIQNWLRTKRWLYALLCVKAN